MLDSGPMISRLPSVTDAVIDQGPTGRHGTGRSPLNRTPSTTQTRPLLRVLLAVLPLSLLCTGCDTLNQLFNKSWLDQSAVIGLRSSTVGLRHQAGLYDTAVGGVPKDAIDPLPEDLQVRREDYVISAGDRLVVEVFELLQVGRSEQLLRQVSDTGNISLPRLDKMHVAGLTEQQAQQAVARGYQDAGLLKEPQVSIVMQFRANRRIYLVGPFGQPGAFDLPSVDFRLLQALSMVGSVANTSIEWLYIIRTENRDGGKAPGEGDQPKPAPEVDRPGASPLPLPGASPLPLPGDAPTVAPTATPTRPDIPGSLGRFNPSDLPLPPRDQPDAPAANHRNGVPATTPPANTARPGHWMIVDGKWTFVPDQPAATPDAKAAAGPRTRIIRIRLADLRAGQPGANIVLRPDDVVVAPQPVVGEFYVMGNVSRPGVYSLSDRQITLTQAIAAAGGFGPLAVPSRVQLIRRLPGGEEEETHLIDAGKILEGKADNYVLHPYDIINVGTSAYAPFLAVLRNAHRFSYGAGFVYDRNFADIDSFSSRANPHDR